ncbi:MAG TPA: hypothetical protein VLT16_07930 [Candidatus Limnocylindrales bacterium]|nr:hypothetical protein [Candidatus Limnocylindrales bacterium]
MKHILVRALVLFLLLAAVAKTPPRWQADLVKEYGYTRFDREFSVAWTKQEGVVFLPDERVLVYQVDRVAEQPQLSARDATGGAGNFLLKITVFNAQDGAPIKSLTLPTSGELSSVLPANSGKFLVRSGDVLYLYSAEFTPIAKKDLPLRREAPVENWSIQVSPSGQEAVLMHYQIFAQPQILMDGSVVTEGKATTDVEVLEAGTLQVKKRFSLGHSLPLWEAVDGMLVTSDPAHSYSDGRLGRMDYTGRWTPLSAHFKVEKRQCPYGVSAAGPGRIAIFGCEDLTVLSVDGRKVFSRKDSLLSFASARANHDLLAIECNRYRLARFSPSGGSEFAVQPDHLELYDMARGTRLLSVPVKSDRVKYAVSSQGTLAVVDGPLLRIFRAGN